MNLSNIKNEALLQNTKNLIKEENRLLAKILAHFLEIDARKLYLEMGYGSLFLLAVKELGYSEASAQRRIEAMRFLKRTPEAGPMVEKGNLNLSNLSLLERVSREAQATHAQSVDALNLLQARPASAAEAETKLRQHFGLKNKKRIVQIEMDEETYQLWQKTKQQLATPRDAEAIKKLCEALPKTNSQTKVRQSPEGRIAGRVLRRTLLNQAEHRCEYVSPITNRRCDNTHFLECDHKVPYFLGGKTLQQNMRVLCSEHNKFVCQEWRGRS